MILKSIVAVLAVLLSFGAALCWFRAGNIKVSPEEAEDLREKHLAQHGPKGHVIWTLLDGSDAEFTLSAQSQWNRRGAFAAGGAALCQAVYVILTEF